MTIKEVLEADWCINHLEIVVRREKDSRYVASYLIGKGVRSPKYAKFADETAAGDIYMDGKRKIVVIDKNIQYRQLEKKPIGREMCVGVLIEKIPKELLELRIDSMMPIDCGRSDDMHGY